MKQSEIRFLAEWEACEAILVSLPEAHTDWAYILDEAREQYRRMVEAFIGAGERCVVLTADVEAARELLKGADSSLIQYVEVEYNDTWTRDYGPLTVECCDSYRLLDFGFNGWGLKFASDRDNLVNLALDKLGIWSAGCYENNRDYELEGGSVESDGRGTVLTTTRCLTSPNRNGGRSKQEVFAELQRRLGVKHLLWLDYGALAGDDTDSHIDTLCRIAPHDTIFFTGCHDLDDPHFEELLKMRAQLETFRTPDGAPYNLVELPFPEAIYGETEDGDTERLPATYANYLVTPRSVFVPTYGQPMNDRMACELVRIAFPEHNVVGIDCRTLIRQHGSLHCATMQLPAGVLR